MQLLDVIISYNILINQNIGAMQRINCLLWKLRKGQGEEKKDIK